MIDRLINILVSIMLIEMMVAVGLKVTLVNLSGAVRNWRFLLQAVLANYVFVPAVTVALLVLFHPADPMVSAGFLLLAVCPGAPFGPLCTGIAKGDVTVAVGLMIARQFFSDRGSVSLALLASIDFGRRIDAGRYSQIGRHVTRNPIATAGCGPWRASLPASPGGE